MIRRAKLLLWLLWVGLAGCTVDASVDTISRTFAPTMFPGAGEHAGIHASYSKELKLGLGSSLPKIITGLELRRASIRPVAGVPDLSFVSMLELSVLGDGTLPGVNLAGYAGTPLGPGGAIEATIVPVELAPYIQKDRPIEVEAEITAPADDWSVEITLEFSAASNGRLMP
jgi:hypothetical protein